MNSRAWAEAPAAVSRAAAGGAGRRPCQPRKISPPRKRSGRPAHPVDEQLLRAVGGRAPSRWKMTGQRRRRSCRSAARLRASSGSALEARARPRAFRAQLDGAAQPAQLSPQPLRENPVTWTYGEGASGVHRAAGAAAGAARAAGRPRPRGHPGGARAPPLAAAGGGADARDAARPSDSPPQPPPSDVDWSEAMRRGLVPATAAHCMITMPPEFEPRCRARARRDEHGRPPFPKFGEHISRPEQHALAEAARATATRRPLLRRARACVRLNICETIEP